MRAAVKILLLSLLVFGATFAMRHTFFWNVKPIGWSDEPPQDGALEMAFLLLSIENIAAVVAAIALVFASVLWVEQRGQRQ